MRISLTNKTAYRDDDLRALVHAACERAGVSLKVLRLTVVSAKLLGRVSGYAYFPSGPRGFTTVLSMRLRIPRPSALFDIKKVAQVALHEAMHLAGARHKDMTEEQYACTMPVPWADGLQLRVAHVASAPAPEEQHAAVRADRLEHAQSMLAKAQTRAKRANTILKKWKRRVTAMERP